jgi:hypothetical protein
LWDKFNYLLFFVDGGVDVSFTNAHMEATQMEWLNELALSSSLLHYYILCLFAKGQTKNLKGLRSKNKKPEGFAKQKQKT